MCAAISLLAGCSKPSTAPTPVAPSLTCPASIALTGVIGGAAQVPYNQPVVAGGAAPVSTVCTPPSGSSFSTGTTPVSCTATDALNRQAGCTFSVTVQALQLTVHRFVAFGDSVTAGEDGRRLHIRIGFVDPVKSYPAVLQSLLTRDFPEQGISVMNEGLGGARATDDVKRLPDVLTKDQPEAVLLLHGYNDLLNDGLSAVDRVVFALRDQIRIVRSRGVQPVFVATLTPSRPATGPFNRAIDPRAIQEVNARLPGMVAGEGATLVNVFDAFAGREAELVEVDGLHLTIAGNEVLAQTFYSAIRSAGLAMGLH